MPCFHCTASMLGVMATLDAVKAGRSDQPLPLPVLAQNGDLFVASPPAGFEAPRLCGTCGSVFYPVIAGQLPFEIPTEAFVQTAGGSVSGAAPEIEGPIGSDETPAAPSASSNLES